jgi:hypothetical protein
LTTEAETTLKLAQRDARLAFDAIQEVNNLLADTHEDIDYDLILPICKETQGRLQGVFSRVSDLIPDAK